MSRGGLSIYSTGGRSRISTNTADLPDEVETQNAKKRRVLLNASVSEVASNVLETMLAASEVGMLEGESRTKAEAFIAVEELKELEARDIAAIDYAEAEKRQLDAYVNGIRSVYSGTIKDTALGSVKVGIVFFTVKKS